ncbi:sulfatase-like hydrolase/transferase [Colwellia sp. E2M01]|uniref:sulfatase-like hydrolase/transferase n=1 Tax=Colwellia sp. E2M01 TaxID=2841561 RepID=UPI001C09BC0C|nr:sulfatase-like hydrolase/transferase [Colwellia sp. E2M01]MBU2870423.1 sulfatase-like hydrolase/transferase [Colwellia sp. E2M01]
MLKTTLIAIMLCSTFVCLAGEHKQPNILLISADDMGFDDRSSQGHQYIKTPSLDTLAQQSVSFTDFNVSPVCSTTRAALLTGRDFYKTGVSGVHGGRDYMHLSETLISNVLQNNNYRTGTWGKWHLGKTKGYLPEDRGFDEAYYAELYQHKNSTGFLNGKPIKHKKWVSEVITDYAIDFMKKPSDKPFFAYVSFLAPHEPWLAPEKYVKPLVEQGLRPAIANLYGMVEEMDSNIGRLLTFLDKNKLANNTIVIFLSDNGPWWDSSNLGAMTKEEWQQRNPSNLKGNKGQTWQNGIQSPLFMRWPAQWQAKEVTRYSEVKDIFPTLIDVLGITLNENHKDIDGYSLLPLILNDKTYSNPRETYIGSHDVISRKHLFNQWTPINTVARDNMFFEDQKIGLRNEKYKLILNPALDRPGYPTSIDNYELFDMQLDPLETHNIFDDEPEISRKMKKSLESKFLSLRNDENAYRTPVFIIDSNDDVSVVNGFGPSNTEGNTQSKAHVLSGLKAKGDLATFQIKVNNNADFDIYIKQRDTNGVGIVASISVGDKQLTHEFTEESIQKVGSLSLDRKDTSFTFKVLKNNSYKPWTEISTLRRFFFVPKGHKIDLLNLEIPQ